LLLALWALCVWFFTVNVGMIHALLVLGVIAIVVHFVMHKAPPPSSDG
jgi:hypothetical protein